MSININYQEKRCSNNAIYIFVAIIYLLDQKINSLFSINGVGLLILLFTFIISYKFTTNRNNIFFIALGLIYIILSFIFSSKTRLLSLILFTMSALSESIGSLSYIFIKVEKFANICNSM